MEITRICDIARDLGQQDLVSKLEELGKKMGQNDTPLILPLVGEFSSGKTTLINALTDSKQLETATRPTTATIYQICFGYDTCKALVMMEDGTSYEVGNISNLKNENLQDATGVMVFDTSTRVPSSTVLVDTPGLSSPDPRHRQVLMEFLPTADAVLLVVDINQQITKSLTDFIKDMALVHRPVYLVVTKSDTKSPSEREEVKRYIAANCQIDISQIACVSAKNDDLGELEAIFEVIRKDKAQILAKVNEQRLKIILQELVERVNELLAETVSDEKLAESIRNSKSELDRLTRNIDNLVCDTDDEVRNAERSVCRNFNNTVFERLDALVSSKSGDFDSAALSIIGQAQSLYLGEFKKQVQEILYEKARNRRLTDAGVNLQSLKEVDCYGQTAFSEIPYNLNLNALGHEYDGLVAGGVKVLATAGLAVATIATAGIAGGIIAGGTVVGAKVLTSGMGKAVVASNVIDTVTDVATMASNKKLRIDMAKVQQRVGQVAQEYPTAAAKVEGFNRKGIIEGFVSKITDNMGKPQRQRAIHEYIDLTLIPHFEGQMRQVSSGVLEAITTTLKQEAEALMAQKRQNLEELEQQYRVSREAFNARRETLLGYKKELEEA